MSSDYDATEFIDGDLQGHKPADPAAPPGAGPAQRAPTREEVDSKVAEAQQKLAELRRAQEELERERAAWKRPAAARGNSRPAGWRWSKT